MEIAAANQISMKFPPKGELHFNVNTYANHIICVTIWRASDVHDNELQQDIMRLYRVILDVRRSSVRKLQDWDQLHEHA
jgi:hypothetical protein